MKKHLGILATLFVLSTISVVAQNTDQSKHNRSAFIDTGLGFGRSSLRDFGTSPLIYKGTPMHMTLGVISIGEMKEVNYGLDVSFGNYSSSIGNEASASQTTTISLRYMELYRLDVFNSDQWNLKVGGKGIFTGNLRINPNLQNAGLGYEVFTNLMLSSKITKNINREEDKHWKIWFLKFTSKARKRNLSYNLNIGLINNNARNGYTYVNQKQVLNKFSLFGGYEINSFNGFRMNSELAYTRYMATNNNAIRISYIWDAFNTKDKYDAFEMAHHSIKISLMYQVK